MTPGLVCGERVWGPRPREWMNFAVSPKEKPEIVAETSHVRVLLEPDLGEVEGEAVRLVVEGTQIVLLGARGSGYYKGTRPENRD